MKKRILVFILTVCATIGAIQLINYVKTSNYDRARTRLALHYGEEFTADSYAFNLFKFNTDQIHSDKLVFPQHLAREFAKHYEAGFSIPVRLYMKYQGHDWDGKADDLHSLVFDDGSSVIADIYCGALRVRYYDGWQLAAKNTLLSHDMRELYITPDGTKLWRNDGRVFCFALNGTEAWLFRDRVAYYCSESEYYTVDIPFDYEEMVRWCGLSSGVITFATYDGKGGVLWLFKDGQCTQVYASPSADADPAWFTASNYSTALLEDCIVYDLPDGKITITSDGKIIEGEV